MEKNAAGLLMEKELEYLGKALSHPQKPFVAILGGAKVSDKIGVIQHLMAKVDALIIGGGMAYTFLKAQGHEIGKSLLEADKLDLAKQTAGRSQGEAREDCCCQWTMWWRTKSRRTRTSSTSARARRFQPT